MGHSHLTAPTSQLSNADFLGLLPHSPHRPYNSNFQMQTFCGCFPLLTDPTSQTSKCRLSGAAFHSSQTLHLKLPNADFLGLLPQSSQTLQLKLPNADFLWLLSTPHRPYISNFQLQTFYDCCTLLTDLTPPISSCRLSMAAPHSSQTLDLKFPAADFLWLLNTPHKLCISPWRGCGKAHPWRGTAGSCSSWCDLPQFPGQQSADLAPCGSSRPCCDGQRGWSARSGSGTALARMASRRESRGNLLYNQSIHK